MHVLHVHMYACMNVLHVHMYACITCMNVHVLHDVCTLQYIIMYVLCMHSTYKEVFHEVCKYHTVNQCVVPLSNKLR